MCMCALSAYICVHHMCAVAVQFRRRHWISLGVVIDGCELLCGCRESNLGPLYERLLSRVSSPRGIICNTLKFGFTFKFIQTLANIFVSTPSFVLTVTALKFKF